MKSTRQILLCGTLAVAAAAIAPCAHAQKIYGEEGSAAATMSVDGKQLPAPPLKFGGVIKEDVKGSKCAPDAPCLNFNALLGGPLEAIAAECGFLDKFLRWWPKRRYFSSSTMGIPVKRVANPHASSKPPARETDTRGQAAPNSEAADCGDRRGRVRQCL